MAYVIAGAILPLDYANIANGPSIGYFELADRYLLPGGFFLEDNTKAYYKVTYIDGKDGTITNTVRRISIYDNTLSVISVHNRTAFLCSYPYYYDNYKASIGYAITSGSEIGALSLIDLPAELDNVAYYCALYDNKQGKYYFGGANKVDGRGIYVVVDENRKTYINHFGIRDGRDITNFKGAIGNNGILYICESSDGRTANNIACYDTNTYTYKGKISPKSDYSNDVTIGTIVIDNHNDLLYILLLHNEALLPVTEIQKYNLNTGDFIEAFTIDEQYNTSEAYLDINRYRMYFACTKRRVVIVDLKEKEIVNNITVPAQAQISNFIYSELWDSAFALTFPDETTPDAPIEVHLIKEINKTGSEGCVAKIRSERSTA